MHVSQEWIVELLLFEVEDEIRAEDVGESETVVNIREMVSGSKGELLKDKEAQLDFKHKQGEEVPASWGSGPEAEAGSGKQAES